MYLQKSIYSFLPFAVCITLLSLLVYGASQQMIRLSAYEMPLLSVQTAQARISIGQQLGTILPNIPIELSRPYGFFFSAYNDQKQLTIAQTTVHATPVTPPSGVFDYAKSHGVDKLTWEPADGVRAATIVLYEPQTKTYLVAGRDLTEYEARTQHIGLLILFGWAVTISATFVAVLFKRALSPLKK